MEISMYEWSYLPNTPRSGLAANVSQKEAYDPRSAKKLTQSSSVASKRSVYTIIFIVSLVIILEILVSLTSRPFLVRHEVEKYPVDFDRLVPGCQSLTQRFEVSSLMLVSCSRDWSSVFYLILFRLNRDWTVRRAHQEALFMGGVLVIHPQRRPRVTALRGSASYAWWTLNVWGFWPQVGQRAGSCIDKAVWIK